MTPQISVGMASVIRLGLGLCFFAGVMAFDMSLNTNLAVYWGQNSFGATNPTDTAGFQQPIEFYCGDDTIDTLPIAFLTEFFSTGNLPTIDLANTCSTVGDPIFPGTNLPNCTSLASGIETCQKAGKIVTLSIGGATGSVTFSSDSEGQAYAKTIWDIFLGGSSDTRPFGTAVLDGIDMDIEGGSQTGYTAFLTALRQLMDGGNKPYFITAAPQCPFPDAYIGTTLNQFAFDAVYVQFYNNFCGLGNFGNSNDFDFSTWDNWAKNTSPNKNIKVYIGAPASSSAAGSGYVSASTLATIVSQTKSQFSSFGGVMLWDASQAQANGRYDQAAKAALTGGSGGPPAAVSSASSGSTTPTASVPSSSSSSSSTSSFSSASAVITPSASASASTPASSSARWTTTTSPKALSTGTATGTSAALSASATAAGGTATGCSGASAWGSNIIYLEGDEVTYDGKLYKAQWWTDGNTPGAPYDGWALVSSC